MNVIWAEERAMRSPCGWSVIHPTGRREQHKREQKTGQALDTSANLRQTDIDLESAYLKLLANTSPFAAGDDAKCTSR